MLADDFFAGLLSAQTGDDQSAIHFLEKVVTSDCALPDELMGKYVVAGHVAVPITEEVAAEVPLGSLAAALTLAEVYQRNGRLDEAIGLLQQLALEDGAHPFLTLSLCDLYAEAEAWDEIADVASGTKNDDDVTLQTRKSGSCLSKLVFFCFLWAPTGRSVESKPSGTHPPPVRGSG